MRKFVFSLILLVFLVGCSNTTSAPIESDANNVVSIEDYKQMVEELNNQILSASVPLGNMAQWELNYMKALGKPSDDIVERAFEWLEKESDYTEINVKEVNSDISAIMIEISDSTDTSPESQMVDIFNQAVSLYENYTGLYETVTTVPSSVNSFAGDISTYFPAIPSDSEALTALLED